MNFFTATLLAVFGVLMSLFMGASSAFDAQVFWLLRVPRTLCGFAIGGGLALAGTLVQASLSNPIADPYALGIASAAALGAILSNLFFTTQVFGTSAFAFLFALAALLGLFFWLRKSFRSSSEILLVGIISGLFFSSLCTFLMALSDPSSWSSNISWLLGSLSAPSLLEAVISTLIILSCLLISWTLWKPLDLLSTSELLAENSGVDVVRIRKIVFIIIALITAISVSIAGVIGFLGFIVPHALRRSGIKSHSRLIPISYLCGSGILLCSDVLARSLTRPAELPVGVIMALLGAPAFLALFRNRRLSDHYET